MTLKDLKTILAGTELPVAYNYFPKSENVSPPCITYVQAYTENFGADDKVFSKIKKVNIHLYTIGKDLTNEAKVETALDGASIFWNSTESYNDDEQVNHIIYEVRING